ncbi:MAG: recombinase family protein [Oscillospiraceae bacterium]|nr:recombinase family protein [Oscillospiraceae bacterium]MBQ8835727.1 recombinase family protein [Oscillospiraceae bacterium]
MNAVVYARFSSHRQGERSIEGQVAEAECFAAAHGLTIVKVYADRAQTGRNDNREQFQRMFADAAKHAFDALIVWKTDRIGRNKEEIALNKYHLKKNGVKIYYVAEAIPDTPEGIILEAVIEGMAAYYSEQLSRVPSFTMKKTPMPEKVSEFFHYELCGIERAAAAKQPYPTCRWHVG